jgi:uncharacterized delta-60 repeat protein
MNTLGPHSKHGSTGVLAATAIALLVLMSGCGGGGGSPTGPVTPRPGTLDTSFNTGGVAITPIGSYASIFAVAVQPDGKIITAGDGFVLVRYNADGTVDSGFGTGGKVFASSFMTNGSVGVAEGVTLQPDGRIVAAGQSSHGGSDTFCTIVRLNTDGSPDLTFGTGGVVMLRVTSLTFGHAVCSAPTVLASGQILAAVGVQAHAAIGEDSETYIGVMRFDPGGARDDLFGVGGVANVRTNNPTVWASSLVVQRDGSIVVGGGSIFLGIMFPPAESLLARFDRTGVPDPGFGQGGVVRWGQNGFTGVGGVALQPDDKIVVALCCEQGHLLRLLPNGAPDTSFGVGGTVTGIAGAGPFGGGPGVAIQSNGKIVVGGVAGLQTRQFHPDSPCGVSDRTGCRTQALEMKEAWSRRS